MDLLKSKKFQASLVGLIVAIAAKVSLDLDEQALLTVLAPILTYIASQGLADLGKGKAEIESK